MVKIKSVTLAWACVVLLVLYMILGLLIWTLFNPNNDGVLAALFAAVAGTAIFVGITLEYPELKGKTPMKLRLSLLFIGAGSGLLSAINWLADEVSDIWLYAVLIAPAGIILFLLLWFLEKVRKEGE